MIVGGLEKLTTSDRQNYITNATLFLNSVLSEGFQKYSDRVIQSEYQDKVASGSIQSSVSFEVISIFDSFFSFYSSLNRNILLIEYFLMKPLRQQRVTYV